ncbi:MAG: hypothetical protein EKK57_07570 [Proteobacteria bacterium]|nr:MAG: hypothetical protein EKK57_07570 [Pseudomonadota bacterium]
MNLKDYLVEREQNKDKPVVEKSYVPYGVYSFADLDSVHAAHEFQEELREMYYDFVVIGDNILNDFPSEAGERLLTLVKEFNARLTLMQRELVSGSIALFKSKEDESLYWVGVPTNKFIDRENDIFSDISHRKLVKSLDEGSVEYPDLYIWHQKPAVGKATWVDYDERGFLVAGGTIYKDYEDLVINLLANSTEPLGMSQGIYRKDIKVDSDGTIIEYKPFEFTFLPHKNACNLLTAFTTQ